MVQLLSRLVAAPFVHIMLPAAACSQCACTSMYQLRMNGNTLRTVVSPCMCRATNDQSCACTWAERMALPVLFFCVLVEAIAAAWNNWEGVSQHTRPACSHSSVCHAT